MGMYTELILKCSIKQDIPNEVNDVLRYLFGESELPECLPKHGFFKCHRWSHLGKSGSFYHHPRGISNYFETDYARYVFSRSDLKNYGSEIELFLDWISPYIDESPGTCIGWYWYEVEEIPTLIYHKDPT